MLNRVKIINEYKYNPFDPVTTDFDNNNNQIDWTVSQKLIKKKKTQ